MLFSETGYHKDCPTLLMKLLMEICMYYKF